jgi:hypothetical protein
MPDDLLKFQGTPPYASELLGMFQPILGWKSALRDKRFAEHIIESTLSVLGVMKIKGNWRGK